MQLGLHPLPTSGLHLEVVLFTSDTSVTRRISGFSSLVLGFLAVSIARAPFSNNANITLLETTVNLSAVDTISQILYNTHDSDTILSS